MITLFTSITGNKDTDLIVLAKLSNDELFIFTKFRNKYINKLCNSESLWRDRLFKYYAEIYPEPEQTWKDLYLNLVYNLKEYIFLNQAIKRASEKGHLEVVKYLMSLPKEYKINPSADNNYAIQLASRNGHLGVIKYLLGLPKEYGINPAADNNFAIIWASIRGHLSVVKYLISLPKEYKINPSAQNNWAVRQASENGHLSVVNYLLSLSKEYGVYL